MNKIIKKSLQSLLLVPVLALGVSAAMPVLQATTAQAQLSGVSNGLKAAQGEGQSEASLDDGIFKTISNTFLFIVGAVAVIMLIYGGFKYVTSGGDSSAVTSAKNTILYAVVGIVVALLAYAVLTFVVGQVSGGSTSSAGSSIGGAASGN